MASAYHPDFARIIPLIRRQSGHTGFKSKKAGLCSRVGGATWPRKAIAKCTHELKTSGQVCG